MKFKKITLKNIRSYEEQEINFPDGSILLSGDIGSGKTSILLAIEYALFGLQPGQTGSALLRNNKDFGEVALEMEISGRSIIIERKLRRKAKSVTNEYASITIDGDKVESSITELKTKILELLGYPIEFIKKNNLLYWQILKGFYDKTGVAGVLNTSFNNHGLPIVDTPKDAVEHLLWGCIDELFMGSFWVRRKGQRATR